MPRSLPLLALALGLVLLPSEVPAAALPLLRAEWGASATAAGWVIGAYQTGYVLAVLILLPLTDRVPSRRVIVTCAAVGSLAVVAFPLAASGVWSAAALRAVAGMALAGVYMPGVRVVAAQASAQRRGLAVAIYVGAFYLATAISLGGTGVVLPALGWRGAAFLLGALTLASAPLALVGTRDAPPPGGRSARLQPSVLARRPVLLTVLAYVGHAWELYLARGWLAAFLAALFAAQGLAALDASARAGQLAALMMGTGTFGVPFGGWLSDRLGRARAALIVAAPCGLISLGFGWLGGLPWAALLALGCAWGLLLAADSAVYSTAITELPPRHLVGSAQAMQAFLGFVATAAAPVAAGVLLDLGLGWGWVFSLGALGALLAVLSLLPLLHARPAARALAGEQA